MAKVQRFFTGSDYDHVAIFLRSGHDIYFLEATGNDVELLLIFCLNGLYRVWDYATGRRLSKTSGICSMRDWSSGI